MNLLKVELENCYGISRLSHEFDFEVGRNLEKPKARAYAIYAPNGLMKSSLAKTFIDLSKNKEPKEERFNRASRCTVTNDGSPLSSDSIYILKAELDISTESPAITNILVNPENKSRYDSLLVELDKLKNKLLNSLQKHSKVKKIDIESSMMADFGCQSFSSCVIGAMADSIDTDMEPYKYAVLFDAKTLEVFQSQEFLERANEFSKRYQEIFEQSGTIYQKGVFNPVKAEVSFGALTKHGFFEGGHRVHLRGESESVNKAELDKKISEINARLDEDESIRNLRKLLAKNSQTQAFTDLIESLNSTQVEFLLENLKLENRSNFRRNLWSYYIQSNLDAVAYINLYEESKDELKEIESAAAQEAPRWTAAVALFNNRFVDMPFILEVANQTQVALGKANAKLKFVFKEGEDRVEWERSELKTLSQGEKRALYLLSFIFEIEARKMAEVETLFIIDDVADSFDYKNKHAIVQYLKDVCATDHFYQLILTHNFDFYRSLANSFVRYDRCLMANKKDGEISLEKAEGIKNYFIGKWKNSVCDSNCILCATIPFVRNLIEYTKGSEDADYLKLTSLLHWKEDTENILVSDYLNIYNRLFNSNHERNNDEQLVPLLFSSADAISSNENYDGLNLEDKVLMSIAIRLKAEQFLLNKLRVFKSDENYWCQSQNQFGFLLKEYEMLCETEEGVRTLEKVSITVSSNIHLNSFMYEPILDLTVDHLVLLYEEVKGLN